MASDGLSAPAALEVDPPLRAAARPAGYGGPDPADGAGEPPVGCRAHPGRAPQARRHRLQAHGPEVHAAGAPAATARPDLGHLFFRPLFAFFVVELASRRAVHVGVTRLPTDAWATQQLREATTEGQTPRFLLRDNDGKFGPDFARVARAGDIEVLRMPPRAPRANAVCERFLGSVRRECLDHVLILGDQHLRRVLVEYVRYFDHVRPHQGLGQRVPAPPDPAGVSRRTDGPALAVPILAGLHHEYRRAA
jgi:putative transposase